MTTDEIREVIQNGSKVTFKRDYGDPSEVFTVSQYNDDSGRGWAGDENNRGWYFRVHQLSECWNE